MQNRYALYFGLLLATGLPAAHAQTALTASNYVTEIITDYGNTGFWRSGNGTGTNAPRNAVKPDNSHHLLAFVVNSGTVRINGVPTAITPKYFSTGVNDARLTSNGIAFNATRYQALPVGALTGTVTSNTKVGLGQLYDGVDNGPSSPPPASGYAQYLTDGTQGLNLGTGTANLPAGTLTFTVSGLSAASIGDGVPDILITQIADPTSVVDAYRFLDASGNLVSGTQVLTANFTNSALIVGTWTADFYEASQNPMTLNAGPTSTKTDRSLRLLAVDLSEFGITASNAATVRQFEIKLSGDSDQAFIAYNTGAASLTPLPVQLVRFVGTGQGSRVQLSWETASEVASAYFEVQASADGQAFGPVGRVAAAGSSTQARHYAFGHQPAQPGITYYRLRQVDVDGTAHYSPVVTVRTGAAAVEVFPNPATDQLTVQLPAATRTRLTLLAPDGRTLWQQAEAEAPARQVAVPGLAALPAGLYLLRAEVDGQASLHRVTWQ